MCYNDINESVDDYMRLKKVALMVLAVIINFIALDAVYSLTSFNGGTGGSYNAGGGTWNSSCVGVKIGIFDLNGEFKAAKVFANSADECGASVVSPIKPKKNQEDVSWSDNVTIFITDNLPNKWTEGSTNGEFKYINFKNHLEKDSYSNLIALLTEGFSEEYDFSHTEYYVTIEPMTSIRGSYKYFGTMYELATTLEKDNNVSCSGYSGYKDCYSKNPVTYISNSLYVSNSIIGINSHSSCNSSEYSCRDTTNDCVKKGNCGAGIGVYKSSDIIQVSNPGKILIEKYKEETDKLITSSSATFELYSGANCQGTPIRKNISTSGGIKLIEDLDEGTYSLKEVGVPRDYTLDYYGNDSCVAKSIVVTADSNVNPVEVKIYNTPTCNADLDDIKNDAKENRRFVTKSELNDLYNKYFQKGKKYRNLLDFSNLNPSSPSFSAKCNSTPTCKNVFGPEFCLTAKYYTSGFSSSNLSCYTSTIDVGSNTGYCVIENFGITPTSAYKNSKVSSVKSGQLYFNMKSTKVGDIDINGAIVEGNLKKVCYFVNPVDAESIIDKKISEYIINGPKLVNSILSEIHDFDLVDTNGEKIVNELRLNKSNAGYVFDLDFYGIIKPVYAEYLTGVPSNSYCSQCRFLGYGILSKFSSDGDMEYSFQTTLKYGDKASDKKDFSGICKYNSKSELIINDKIQAEFRAITKSNPFLDKNGNARDTKTNWCNGTDCSSDNDVVKQYITDTNDSYNTKGDDPIYTITLTPSDIKNIRNDIKSGISISGTHVNLTYDGLETLKCNDDTHVCASEYLNILVGRGIVIKN